MLRFCNLAASIALLSLAACGSGGGGGGGGGGSTVTTTIPDVTAYMSASVCADGTLEALEPGCISHQLISTEPMMFHRHDWPPRDDQVSDTWRAADGSYPETFSYPPHGPFVAADGDGGDLLVAEAQADGTTAVRISFTQNGNGAGGTIAGWWVGPSCGGSGWLLFDDQAPTGSWRSRIAYLAGSSDPNACPKLNPAYTQWRLETVAVPFIVGGVQQVINLPAVVSEHYAGTSIATSTSMERLVLAKGVPRVLWEAWNTTGPATTWSCPGIPGWSDPPAPGWFLRDRRCLTDVRPADGSQTGSGFGWP